MSNYVPLPTYTNPIILDSETGSTRFTPSWELWLFNIGQLLPATPPGGTKVAFLGDAQEIISNQMFGP